MPSQAETDYVKKLMKLERDDVFNSSAALNQVLGSSALNNNFNLLLNGDNFINNISSADMAMAARKYLDLNKVSIGVVHPKETANKASTVAFKGNLDKKMIDVSMVREYTLPNNVYFTYNSEDVEKSIMVVTYDVPQNHKYKPGVSSVLSRMLKEGTANVDKKTFYTNLRNDLIGLSVGSYGANIEGSIGAFTENLPKAISILKDNIENPNFTQENFDKIKNDLIESISCAKKGPFNKLMKELHPDCPVGYTREEVLASLKTMTLDDVKAFHHDILTQGRARVVVTAPKEYEQVAAQLLSTYPQAKQFDKKIVEEFQPLTETKIVTEQEKCNQADIIQAFKFKVNQNPRDKVVFQLMNMILGGNSSSRLFQDLREKQKLAYYVRSHVNMHNDTGVLMLNISTTTDNPLESENKLENLDKSLDGFKKHIELMKNTQCSEDELNKCKKMLKTKMLNMAESANKRTVMLSGAQKSLNGIAQLEDTIRLIDTVTPQDIQNAANYVFNSPSVISVLGSEETLKQLDKYTKKSAV